MTEAVDLAFAVGLLALVSPCALPWLAAFAGWRLAEGGSRGDAGSGARRGGAAAGGGLRDGAALPARLRGAAWAGGQAALGAGAVHCLAAACLAAGVDVNRAVPPLAVAGGTLLAVTGAMLLARRPLPAVPALGAGAALGLAAAPCTAALFRTLVDQGLESRGAVTLAAFPVLFTAGAAALLVAVAVVDALIAAASARSPAAGVRRVAAGVLLAAAGAWAVLYWLPSLPAEPADRGGPLAELTNDLAGGLTTAVAEIPLLFAAVLLVAAVAALVAAVRAARLPSPARQSTGI